MSYSFTRNREGSFNSFLGDIIYNYSQLKEVANSANYLDLTLVDEDNSVVIYKQLQDVQFCIEMDICTPRRIAIKVDSILVTFEIMETTREVLCRVETFKENQRKVFYPSLITIFN